MWPAAREDERRRVDEVGAAIQVLLAKSSGEALAFLLVYIVAAAGVFYLLLVRPRRRRRQAQQALLSAIQKGDEVVTIDGMVGTVRQIRERFVVVEVADHKRVRLLRSAVSQVLHDGGATPARR